MNALVDTNVLLRLADENHAMHAAASAVIEALRRTRTLCIFPQNLYEFWVVATRPVKDNGLGYTQAEALAAITALKTFYHLIPETGDFFSQWKSLLHEFTVLGKIGHDAHLFAGMRRRRGSKGNTRSSVWSWMERKVRPKNSRMRGRSPSAKVKSTCLSGIYKQDGDILVLMLGGAQEAKNRPKEFKTLSSAELDVKDADGGRMLLTLKKTSAIPIIDAPKVDPPAKAK